MRERDDTNTVHREESTGIVPTKRRRWLYLCGLVLALTLAGSGWFAFKVGNTFSVVSERIASFLGIRTDTLPLTDPEEKHRLDILVLGLRGEGEAHGGSLTDMLLLISIKTDEKKAALISIPRDTYVAIPFVHRSTKINEAFELGEEAEPGGGGLFLARRAAEEVTGVNIDYAVSVDFQAFEEVIDDILGGVDVEVQKPFRENLQWGGMDFYIPQGTMHMDGETALLYVRSRFTTSDFDRARRQQEVLLAIRKRGAQLGFAAHPEKVLAILDTLGRHVRTDAGPDDILNLARIAPEYTRVMPKQLVLDAASGLLESSTIDGSYVLLPSGGSFERIHERVRSVFDTTGT